MTADKIGDMAIGGMLGLMLISATMFMVLLFHTVHRKGWPLRRAVGLHFTGPIGEAVLRQLYKLVRRVFDGTHERAKVGYKVRQYLDKAWARLPDKCQNLHCNRKGVRGNENIATLQSLHGPIEVTLCDGCHSLVTLPPDLHDPRTDKDEPDQ